MASSLYNKFEKLCSPAQLYVAVSLVGLLFTILTSLFTANSAMHASASMIVYGIVAAFVLGWTWILNLICKDGHTNISWALVLVPHIVVMLGTLSLLLTKKIKMNESFGGLYSALFVAAGVYMMHNK
jgi:hypothetical protein